MEPTTHLRVLSFEEALAAVRKQAGTIATKPAKEALPLLAAKGRVLAQAVIADRDQPPFDRSTRDGFALRVADVANGGAVQMVGQVQAGDLWSGAPLQQGQAVEIMTGAPVPAGADCVVMIEHVEQRADGESQRIRLAAGRSIRAGENIVPEGSEARAGDVLLPSGTPVGAAEIAVAASCGYARLKVFAPPRVAVIATGDELVEVEEQPLLHQVRNSNSYSLAAQITASGAEAVRFPIARDTRESLLERIQQARGCDLMLLTGGVSMGKYDLVEEVLLELGAEFFFTGAKIQPGKPVVFGRLPANAERPEQYFFGLPGNPVSTQVTYLLFVEPLLGAMCGAEAGSPRFVQAILTEPVRARRDLLRFLPALLRYAVSGCSVRQVAWQGSGDQAANARANCYLVVPPDRETIAAGESVTVLLR
ncbi:MAG: molybdopterin molybdotransferase MoeA [Acidobacteriaceae bacterium]